MADFIEPPDEVWMIGVIPPSAPARRLLFDNMESAEAWLRENLLKTIKGDRRDEPWEVRSIFVLREGRWHHFIFQFEQPRLVESLLLREGRSGG